MAATGDNGVLRIDIPDGQIKCQVGKEGDVFELDVVGAYNRWIGFRQRMQAEAGVDPADWASLFVQELGGGTKHNRAEAMVFVEKVCGLADDLAKKNGIKPSSATDTDSTASG